MASDVPTIRRVRPEDAPALAAAARAIARTPGRLAARPEEIHDDDVRATIVALEAGDRGAYLVAEHRSAIAGHALLERLPLAATAHVCRLTIAVHEGHERRGIGAALMRELLAWARAAPAVEKVELQVRSSNEPALALYRSLGFVEEGRKTRRVKLGPNAYLDDVYMALWVGRVEALPEADGRGYARRMPTFSRDLYMRAWNFATERHHGQKMPGSELPYIAHVGAVAMEVLGAITEGEVEDPDLATACALLHDTVEDTRTTAEEIASVFGAAVARGVLALSKDGSLPKEEQMADSLRRIRGEPHAVWIVKLADRTVNMEAPPHYWPEEKRRAYQREARTILEELGAACPSLAQRLGAKIAAYDAFLVP